MAKVTTEYIINEFYVRFGHMPEAEQRGIIAGLRAVMRCMAEKDGPEVEGPLFAEVGTESEA